MTAETIAGFRYAVGEAAGAVSTALEDWRAHDKVRRLWAGDASLWTGTDEARWLGWLRVLDDRRERADEYRRLGEAARAGGFAHVVVLGMGGSSLCPDVLARTFGRQAGFPELLVLDSTVPAQVRALARRVDPGRALFVVSSKSGTTIEPNVFAAYFLERVEAAVGAGAAGAHFIAITDPGTPLEALARARGFRHVAHGLPDIGGRFSALSSFGMVPAALMGLDVPRFLDRAAAMAEACGASVPPARNPGVALGAVLGTLAGQGRDKVTLVASPRIAALGGWLEQLLAESTGKQGRGLVPVDGEPLGAPEAYGRDRVFVYSRLTSEPSAEQAAAVAAFERAGQPVVRIDIPEPMALGAEFFRWEMATAVAGSILGVDPFDQPDVEAAKVAARRLTAAYEAEGRLPDEAPLLEDGDLRLFADARNAGALAAAAGGTKTAAAYLRAHLDRLRPGDYFAVNAFVAMSEAPDRELTALRRAVRDARGAATTVGYGPRFLHSTGQLHKGGPSTGLFLQLTADTGDDVPIPGHRFGFGVLARAQARGDFEVLAERGRR
ncbi:MAG: bifunctional transaldolase/phosoglucose isomerase, partial [Candidatus Rokuibacteriota bacterium]